MPLPGDAVNRQGRILKLAIEALGASEAMAFLNSADSQLGGRPLDLAIASEQGLQMVAQAIAQKHPDAAG